MSDRHTGSTNTWQHDDKRRRKRCLFQRRELMPCATPLIIKSFSFIIRLAEPFVATNAGGYSVLHFHDASQSLVHFKALSTPYAAQSLCLLRKSNNCHCATVPLLISEQELVADCGVCSNASTLPNQCLRYHARCCYTQEQPLLNHTWLPPLSSSSFREGGRACYAIISAAAAAGSTSVSSCATTAIG